ncbi:MAG: pyruvate, phosphate dikinase, partial [Methanobacteriota archaeon]
MRELLGGKGAGLAEMTRLRLPVPPGFTITTEACNSFSAKGKFPPGLQTQIATALRKVETAAKRRLGDPKNPLLVSVRSGAKFSMPGMMDTVLNVGLNDDVVAALAKSSQNERFVWDAYRRLLQMFGRIVRDIDGQKFEAILGRWKAKTAGGKDTDLTANELRAIVKEFEGVYRSERKEFPQNPREQLEEAIKAVFQSWNGKRAVDYRTFHKIPHDLGTAANVQAMVFGNLGEDSGTGVVFTRNPATGERGLYGEYLANAQGEDVVAGIRTPVKIAELKGRMPKIYRELEGYAKALETHYKDLQDIEFTVEGGKLWVLQTRAGKRTARAAVKAAVDMAGEKLISRDEAVLRVEPAHVIQLLMPRFDEGAKATAHKDGRYLAKGLNASPGAATGAVVFDPDEAQRLGRDEKKPVILVRVETSPDDVHGMLWAKGILTTRGGATSHASVVARGLGLPCIVGAESIRVDYEDGTFSAGESIVRSGDAISIDGTTGEVFLGRIPTIDPDFKGEKELQTILSWADKARRLQVWGNADYPRDAIRAREFGAQGVGLCRTEHMFFEEERLPIVQRMILAATERERQEALDKLLPIQRGDFDGILAAMGDLPVVIRLIDPPLHEFLPKYEDLLVEATELRLTGKDAPRLAEVERLLKAVAAMKEQNPMLGLRGCRLGIMFPGVTEMQVRAIFEAAAGRKRAGGDPHPEIMIPLVGHVNELRIEREKLERVAKQVMKEQGVRIDYKFGTMIEVPRGAITADEIAEYAEFFSFGTNDLTQMTFGYSRDDAEGKFLMSYVERGILPANPF